jgi:hypothetical protein
VPARRRRECQARQRRLAAVTAQPAAAVGRGTRPECQCQCLLAGCFKSATQWGFNFEPSPVPGSPRRHLPLPRTTAAIQPEPDGPPHADSQALAANLKSRRPSGVGLPRLNYALSITIKLRLASRIYQSKLSPRENHCPPLRSTASAIPLGGLWARPRVAPPGFPSGCLTGPVLIFQLHSPSRSRAATVACSET